MKKSEAVEFLNKLVKEKTEFAKKETGEMKRWYDGRAKAYQLAADTIADIESLD